MESIKIVFKYKPLQIALYVSVILFILSFLVGFLVDLLPSNKGFFGEEKALTTFSLFVHNFSYHILNVLGMITLGLYNFFSLTLNGLVIGTTLKYAIKEYGFLTSFLRLFIHGFLEVPLILLSSSIGIMPLISIIYHVSQEKKFHFKKFLKNILLLLLILLIFTLIAAFLEAHVSSLIKLT